MCLLFRVRLAFSAAGHVFARQYGAWHVQFWQYNISVNFITLLVINTHPLVLFRFDSRLQCHRFS